MVVFPVYGDCSGGPGCRCSGIDDGYCGGDSGRGGCDIL